MTPEQIAKRFAETIAVPERKMVDTPCNRTGLTFTKFKTYLGARNVHWNESKFEENFSLRAPDGKYNLIADLLADENSDSIKVAIFRGTDKSDYLKRNEYGFTCLLYAMDQVSEYCLALNETFVDTSKMVRQEKKLDEQAAKLIESHRKVLTYLLNNPEAKLSEAAANCSLSLGGVKKIVQSLKKDGLIKREGNRKNSRWTR